LNYTYQADGSSKEPVPGRVSRDDEESIEQSPDIFPRVQAPRSDLPHYRKIGTVDDSNSGRNAYFRFAAMLSLILHRS
jgi:hypothetical protein